MSRYSILINCIFFALSISIFSIQASAQGRLFGTDAYGNIYGVPGNTGSCGKVIDPSKEIQENLTMIEKRIGKVSVGDEGRIVTLLRNVQTGKLTGTDAWENEYGVVGNATPSGKVIDPSKEKQANVEMTEERIGKVSVGDDGKVVTLMKNVQTGKLSGCDALGNIYGVAGNTNANGEIIDLSKETEANVELCNNRYFKRKPVKTSQA